MSFAQFALIRFGSGLSPRYPGPATPDALMESLADDATRQAFPMLSAASIQARIANYSEVRVRKRDSEAAEMEFQKHRDILNQTATLLRRLRIARAVDAPVGFAERLAQFWAGHFSVATNLPDVAVVNEVFQEQVIREHQLGHFGGLLRAATLHPAMLRYLNQNASTGPHSRQAQRLGGGVGLNENHARELLELHTLGVGDAYSQKDIRQLAELMTGLGVTRQSEFHFTPARVEPGPETVLGKTYGGANPPRLDEIEAFLDDLAVHPRTAAFICGKLARHFCADAPSDRLVAAMTHRFRKTDGDLSAVYAVMVDHKDARTSFGQKVRQPLDLIVAGLRSLGAHGTKVKKMPRGAFRRTVLRPLEAMGQPVNGAPQPEGWPEAEADWLTPQQLAGRINWALDMPRVLFKPLPDVAEFVGKALPEKRAAQVGPIAARAETRADGIAMVLASPQFNRR